MPTDDRSPEGLDTIAPLGEADRADRLRVMLVLAGVLVAVVVARLVWVTWIAPPAAADPSAMLFRVQVNAADATELQLLPGVGPTLADRIVEHRRRRGPFRSASDMLAVPGIGRRTVDRIAPYADFAGPSGPAP